MDEKEELVKKALFSFVRKQVPTAQLRYNMPGPSCPVPQSAFLSEISVSVFSGSRASCLKTAVMLNTGACGYFSLIYP